MDMVPSILLCFQNSLWRHRGPQVTSAIYHWACMSVTVCLDFLRSGLLVGPPDVGIYWCRVPWKGAAGAYGKQLKAGKGTKVVHGS